jgi:antitoxin YefM
MSALISYTDAQVNLDQLCDQVVETGEAVIITRSDGKMWRWWRKVSCPV